MKHIKGLDTLRAFAVFVTITEHFGVWFDDTTPSGSFFKKVIIPNGGFGVYLFFVLSGFLITSILLKEKNTYQGGRKLFIIKNFFIRRALRIFPIYYLLVFVLFQINFPQIKQNIIYLETYTLNILCWRTNSWNSFSHTWTLDIEEQFYLLWPWLIIFINNKYVKYVFFAAIFTGVLTTYIGLVAQQHMGPLLAPNCFDSLGIGGLYAWSRMEEKRSKKYEFILKTLGVLAVAVYFYWKISGFYHFTLYGEFLWKTVCSFVSILLIILVVNCKTIWITKYILENRFLNFIGKISYGLYLYHYIYLEKYREMVGNYFNEITQNFPTLHQIIMDRQVYYWIHIAIMIGIATISYKLIEAPLLKLKKRFA